VDHSPDPNDQHRKRILIAAFLAWMFAGLENSLFILIHRQMMLELLGPGTAEKVVAEWFAWFQAAFLLGAAAGGWLFGAMGDRLGRTRAMGLSVACYSGLTLSCYWIEDPHLMWIVRFLACLGFGGSWPNAVAIVSEAWPSASRPLMAGVMGTAANFGFVLMGVVGYSFAITGDNWRWTLFIGGSPLLLAAWILLGVPESRKWLNARVAATSQSAVKAPVIEVFQRPLLYRTLLGISLGAIPVVGTAANANWIVPWTDQYESRSAAASVDDSQLTKNTAASGKSRKADPRKKALAQIQRSSGAIFGSLLGGFIASVVGRRLSYFLISLGTFVASSILFTQLNPHHHLFPYATFALGFFGVTYFGWLPLFLPELFPTRVRSTGTGISFNTGRVIAAMVVLLAAFRMDRFEGDYAKVGFWSGMIYVVGMIIIWLAPRHDDQTSEIAR
jgi:MFS family permease